jgi:hypothetical protein
MPQRNKPNNVLPVGNLKNRKSFQIDHLGTKRTFLYYAVWRPASLTGGAEVYECVTGAYKSHGTPVQADEIQNYHPT